MIMPSRFRDEGGAVLIVVLMAMLLLSSLGLMLVMSTMAEALVVANFRTAQEALYAADGALERVVADLRVASDWSPILAGDQRSTFVDGPAGGSRTLADGVVIDLTSLTNILNCGRSAGCATVPRWRLYLSGRLSDVLGVGSLPSSFYVTVWVADGRSAGDDPDTALAVVHAEALGPRGARKVVEATVARRPAPKTTGDAGDSQAGWAGPAAQVLSWRQLSP